MDGIVTYNVATQTDRRVSPLICAQLLDLVRLCQYHRRQAEHWRLFYLTVMEQLAASKQDLRAAKASHERLLEEHRQLIRRKVAA